MLGRLLSHGLLSTGLALMVLACSSTESGPPATATFTPVTSTPPPVEATEAPSTPASPAAVDSGCPDGREKSMERLASLEQAVNEAMEGYDGTWGMALENLDCDTSLAINPDYRQYPASAGKIVTVIAVLREVEAGNLAFEDIREPLVDVMTHSTDDMADVLTQHVDIEAIQQVLDLAGFSEASTFEHDWRSGFMRPADLTTIWRSLIEGDLLGPEWTEELMQLAAGAEIPEGYETFPPGSSIDDYEFGQKAGFYVYDGLPYYFVGAGYLVPGDGEGPRFTMALMIETENPDLEEPQRRAVFDLLLEYAFAEEESR